MKCTNQRMRETESARFRALGKFSFWYLQGKREISGRLTGSLGTNAPSNLRIHGTRHITELGA